MRKLNKKTKKIDNIITHKGDDSNKRRILRSDRSIKPTISLGKYSAKGVCLTEASINNSVLRIPIQDCRKNISGSHNKTIKITKKSRFIKQIAGLDSTRILSRTLKRTKRFSKRLHEKVDKWQFPKTKSVILRKKEVNKVKDTMKSSQHLKNSLRKNLSMIIESPKTNGVFDRNKLIKAPRQYRAKEKHCYFLKFTPYQIGEESKLNYDFHILMNSVKNMKLPAPNWKIKIMVRQTNVFSILITNGQVFERSLTFFAQSAFYNIVIDNIAVVLIGSPKTIDSVSDIEVLLDIIEHINISDPMIKFK